MKISIVGLGYVGLLLALQCARKGVEVLGLDVDEVKVDALNVGRSYIKQIPETLNKEELSGSRIRASTDFSFIKSIEAVNICVPTPLFSTAHTNIDYGALATWTEIIVDSRNAMAGTAIRPGQL